MTDRRTEEIIARLKGHGPTTADLYSNQEMVNRLVDLQEVMSKEVSVLIPEEQFSAREMMPHFWKLAEQYGLQKRAELRRLSANMELLKYTIGSLKRGLVGECIARNSLQSMTSRPDVQILYNISLQDVLCKAEYDAIVITTYGIFVIEVKNFSNTAYINHEGMLRLEGETLTEYNLSKKMNTKKLLLRNCLRDLPFVPYQYILLNVNKRATIIDHYGHFPIANFDTIITVIQGCDKTEKHVPSEVVQKIAACITEHGVESKYPCTIDCSQIIEDLAILISEIEDCANVMNPF